jgi:hypothetical protein
MVATILALSVTGRWPGGASLVRFEPNGIVELPAEQIRHVEIVEAGDQLVFRRQNGGWALHTAEADSAPGKHIETALRFLNVSAPTRVLPAGAFGEAEIAEFGLDPPRQMIGLVDADGAVTSIGFGVLNPAQASHYARVVGRSSIYLMPRHVGAEWQLASDMARRSSRSIAATGERPLASTAFLLPVSLAQIWAVEIVAEGTIQRLERDRAGDWFQHVGEHVHIGSADAHIADPRQAKAIASELAAFEQTPIEQVIATTADTDLLTRTGLARPSLIVLLYGRDNPRAVTRIELGTVAGDGFQRYARTRDGGTVVTIPGYAAAHLAILHKLAK